MLDLPISPPSPPHTPPATHTADMQAIRAQVVVSQASQAAAKPRMALPAAVVRPLKAVGVSVASLALALSANAATVKLVRGWRMMAVLDAFPTFWPSHCSPPHVCVAFLCRELTAVSASCRTSPNSLFACVRARPCGTQQPDGNVGSRQRRPGAV